MTYVRPHHRVTQRKMIAISKRIPTLLVVQALGLEKGEEALKYKCPRHGGFSLHVYDYNAMCYGGCKSFDNIDLVRTARDVGFGQALDWLRQHFPCIQGGAVPPLVSARPRVDHMLQARIMSELLSRLKLTPAGKEYIAGRSLDPEKAATTAQLRSVDAAHWDQVRLMLRRYHSEEALGRAGLRGWGYFSQQTAWKQPLDVLLIPIFDRLGSLLTVRMRRTCEAEGPKYTALKGAAAPTDLYGAQWVYPNVFGGFLHITEGELDAWTLYSAYGELALGAYGAGQPLPRGWAKDLQGVDRIAIWGDGDPAGRSFANNVWLELTKAMPLAWVEHRVTKVRVPEGHDVSSLHQQGHDVRSLACPA